MARWSSATTSRWRSSSPRSRAEASRSPTKGSSTTSTTPASSRRRKRSSASSRAEHRIRRTFSRQKTAGAWWCRRSSRTRRCASSSTCTGRHALDYGNEPDIVWIHACYLDEDRDTALREAEQGIKGFLAGNASPLTEHERPPADELTGAGYGFYTAGILEKLAETPYDELIAGDIVWVGTPEDVIERIEGVLDVCEGLTEISITVNPGGFDHLAGDQEPGAVRAPRDAALQGGEARERHRVSQDRPPRGLSLVRLTSSAPSQSRSWPLTSSAGIARLPIWRGAGFQTPHERR